MAALNGWQRLWVVVTVFWTVAGLSVSYVLWPGPSSDLRWAEAQAVLSTDPYAGETVAGEREFQGDSLVSSYHPCAGELPPGLSWFERNAPEASRRYVKDWKTCLEPLRQSLRNSRVEHVQVTLMCLAIPSVFLYAFGWSVGWIRRGFRG